MESTNHNGSLLGAGQLVTCRLDELNPHPSYVRHHLAVPASQLSALAERGDRAFLEPLMITQDRTILDGYARLELARLHGRATLPCIEYELTESEALHWLLQKHRRSSGLNDFTRILLALELEPWFKEKARSNQQAGGRQKGSSKLTEAGRLDVRSEIAAAAGVSVGNVTKVKQVTTTAMYGTAGRLTKRRSQYSPGVALARDVIREPASGVDAISRREGREEDHTAPHLAAYFQESSGFRRHGRTGRPGSFLFAAPSFSTQLDCRSGSARPWESCFRNRGTA